jgi:hypothetical protein
VVLSDIGRNLNCGLEASNGRFMITAGGRDKPEHMEGLSALWVLTKLLPANLLCLIPLSGAKQCIGYGEIFQSHFPQQSVRK